VAPEKLVASFGCAPKQCRCPAGITGCANALFSLTRV
jgi:hypothetical protein